VPGVTNVTVPPEVTVQTPVVAEINVTPFPEGPPVAVTVNVVPKFCVPGFPNVIVCGVPATVTDWLTCGAAA